MTSDSGPTLATAIGPIQGQRVLAERIYEALKMGILSLELAPGASLVERELARRFGVSKSPVRDALQRLAGEGLVAPYPHRGMIVQSFDPDYVYELYDLRIVLESLAITLATPRFTPADIEEAEGYLRLALAGIERHDWLAVSAANQQFHLLFSRCSGNRPLHATLTGLQDRVRVIGMRGWHRGASMRQEHQEHAAILEAVANRQTERAAELLRDHIDGFRCAYREAMNRGAAAENG